MRYVTLEGHHKTIYAYHFGLLNHFRYGQDKEVNFPFFIYHSMKLSVLKCKETQDKIPKHQGVIKLVFDVALAKQPPKTPSFYIGIEEENTPLTELFSKK